MKGRGGDSVATTSRTDRKLIFTRARMVADTRRFFLETEIRLQMDTANSISLDKTTRGTIDRDILSAAFTESETQETRRERGKRKEKKRSKERTLKPPPLTRKETGEESEKVKAREKR